MSVAEPHATVSHPKLRWYQYSLRTLLVFVTLLCTVACSWIGVKLRQAERQRTVVEAITKLGGDVGWCIRPGPAWLQPLLGDDYYGGTIDGACFFGPHSSDGHGIVILQSA